MSRDGQRGQASVEHVALVVVVAVVLVVAGAVAGAPSIVNAVHSGIRRAICVAGGDTCAPFHLARPCTVARRQDLHDTGVSVLLVRIGGSETLVVERRSDGSVAVTSYLDNEAGLGGSVGARLSLGRRTRGDRALAGDEGGGIGVDVSAGVEGRLRGGVGQTWEFPDARAAEGLIRRLRDAYGEGRAERAAARRAVRAPDVERVRVGVDGTVTGEISGPLGLDLAGTAFAGLHGEGARDRRTGETTVTVALPGSVAAELDGPLRLRADGAVRVDPSATIVLGRDGRARELRLAGRLTTRDGTRARELALRVDLTRPTVREEVEGMVRGLTAGRPGEAAAAARRLGRWAVDDGWVDEREYRTAEATDGVDAELGLGLKLGLKDQEIRSTARLVGARSRPPGGLWESRTDCLAAR
ncbi:hypothetical protein [Patulibacter sp. SYSU D01012]|uniref:hypothetical protein n=1 Tax=Patulibacter sp. SYSU D01012 TaxID=2817381 RepID=UPI001B310FD0|nr:hypothetical protein [Patulibacter sp. SYSU D01012]